MRGGGRGGENPWRERKRNQGREKERKKQEKGGVDCVTLYLIVSEDFYESMYVPEL